MRRLISVIAAVTLTMSILALSRPGQAASPEDVRKIVEHIKHGDHPDHMIHWEVLYSAGVKITFNEDGRQYVLHYCDTDFQGVNGSLGKPLSIDKQYLRFEIYSVTDLTHEHGDAVADSGLTGIIHTGFHLRYDGNVVDEGSTLFLDQGPNYELFGPQYRDMWQDVFDRAVRDTLHTFEHQH